MRPHDAELRRALAGEYALGVMTERTRRRFEKWLALDHRLRAEVDGWADTFAPLLDRVPEVTPSPAVWRRVEQGIGPVAMPVRSRKPYRLWLPAAAAVLAALLVWLMVGTGPGEETAPSVVATPEEPGTSRPDQDTAGPAAPDEPPEQRMVDAEDGPDDAPSVEADPARDVDPQRDDLPADPESVATADDATITPPDASAPESDATRDGEPGLRPQLLPGSETAEDLRRVARLASAEAREGWIVEVFPSQSQAVATSIDPAAIQPNQSFQLWAVNSASGVPQSLGLLQFQGIIELQLSPDQLFALDTADLLAVSVEQLGGSSTGRPDGPIVYTGSLDPPPG